MDLGRNGVSEIVGSLIVITIAVSIGIGLYVYSISYFSMIRSRAEHQYIVSSLREKEAFTLINTIYESGNLTLFIYNYGGVEVRLTDVYLDGNHVELNETVIPQSSLGKVSLRIQLSEGIHFIKIVSKRGASYEGYFKV